MLHLNFTVPSDISSDLEAALAASCRTLSSVVRQLILEYVEGDCSVDPSVPFRATGKRTSLALSSRVMAAFDAKVSDDGHPSKGAVITCMLRSYVDRSLSAGVDGLRRVSADVPRPIYTRLLALCDRKGESLGALLVSALCEFLDRAEMR